MDDEAWIAFTRFLGGGQSRNIRPVRKYKVRKDMFTFPKGMQCWIAEDGHMYTLQENYHESPRVIQMYVKSTIERFSYRFDEFFTEIPMLNGEMAAQRKLNPRKEIEG